MEGAGTRGGWAAAPPNWTREQSEAAAFLPSPDVRSYPCRSMESAVRCIGFVAELCLHIGFIQCAGFGPFDSRSGQADYNQTR